MLKFDRPAFRAGVVVCKEVVPSEGGEKVLFHRFYPKDKGKTFEFQNEEYLLQKYPILFTVVE